MRERGIVPRKVKGFRDTDPDTNRLRWKLIDTVTAIYRRYGFEHWDTPIVEYAETLGRYLPDEDTVDEGIYSFRNPEEEPVLDKDGRELRDERNHVVMEHHHLALRYDMTAPLARMYAERVWPHRNQARGNQGRGLPVFRRYQFGPVFRFEAKLDPGRYRQFWQLDFDTVGVEDPAADAEVCCILCDSLEALGLDRGSYEVKVNSRKLHQGVFEMLGVGDDPDLQRDILRVVDKYDKLGLDGVAAELGKGWKDPESGAFVPGLGLDPAVIDALIGFMQSCVGVTDRRTALDRLHERLDTTAAGREGLAELEQIHAILDALGYGSDRVVVDPTVARGLAYYTGPVFEAVSKLEYRDDKGRVRRFGSICGGGRYDGLVKNLLGVPVPATGASIGLDRLVELLSKVGTFPKAHGPVLVVVMDRERMADYQVLAAKIRAAGIPTEVYYGRSRKLKAQFAYADQRNSPVAVVAGSNEFEKGTVSIKNLILGKELSQGIKDRKQWLEGKPAQVEVPVDQMVETIRAMLADM